jgi:hypothetical protein
MDFTKIWKSYLEEIVDSQFVDVTSLKIKKELTPEIWDGKLMKPEVRDAALEVAHEFFDTLELDPSIMIKDIILTGSLATYNWSDMSDFDLHILIGFNELKDLPLMEDYFKQKTRNWNNTHKILIKGYELEMYIQDSNEPHYANGIYSLLNDEWIKEPSKFRGQIDYETIQEKSARLMEEIDNIYDYYAEKDYRTAHEMAEHLMERIRKYRRAGLSTNGIQSVENLVFKTLRRNEYIKKLSSLRILAYDAMMSVNGLDEVFIEED